MRQMSMNRNQEKSYEKFDYFLFSARKGCEKNGRQLAVCEKPDSQYILCFSIQTVLKL